MLFAGICFTGCTPKDHPTPPAPFNPDYTLTNQPEADAANDLSNYGIYKGVVINAQDSTATFKFNLYNRADQPYALMRASAYAPALARIGVARVPNLGLARPQAAYYSFYRVRWSAFDSLRALAPHPAATRAPSARVR